MTDNDLRLVKKCVRAFMQCGAMCLRFQWTNKAAYQRRANYWRRRMNYWENRLRRLDGDT
jgi:hypothetical protein